MINEIELAKIVHSILLAAPGDATVPLALYVEAEPGVFSPSILFKDRSGTIRIVFPGLELISQISELRLRHSKQVPSKAWSEMTLLVHSSENFDVSFGYDPQSVPDPDIMPPSRAPEVARRLFGNGPLQFEPIFVRTPPRG